VSTIKFPSRELKAIHICAVVDGAESGDDIEQCGEEACPSPTPGPAIEPPANDVVFGEATRKVGPGGSCPRDPEGGIEGPHLAPCVGARVTGLAGVQVGDSPEGFAVDLEASHRSALPGSIGLTCRA